MAKQRPNILFFQTDQHRMDALGCYGNEIVRTPNIDRLAAGGMRFTNAFTCTAVCTPARGALLSGRYPHKTGMIYNPELPSGFGGRLCEYTERVTPFSEPLRKAGYECHHIGKWHIGSWFGCRPADYGFKGAFYPGYGYPRQHKRYLNYLKKFGASGFELRIPREGKTAARYYQEHNVPAEASVPGYLASQTINALQRLTRGGKRFFLSCNFWGPHMPAYIPREYLYMYDPHKMPLPPNLHNVADHRPEIVLMAHKMWGGSNLTEEMVRNIIAKYYGYVTLIDHQVGRVLDFLDGAGMLENTMIIFSADHGATLGAHGLQDKGLNMYDEVYRIPLIISGPLVKKKGAAVDRIVSHIDLSPTFIAIAGGRVPSSYDGQSLKPYLDGKLKHIIRKEMVMEGFGHQTPFLQRAIRDHRFKYIFSSTAVDEFYDMQHDPYETTNLIDTVDRRLPMRYRRKLRAWMDANGDPLLRFFTGTTFRDAHTGRG